MGGDPDTVTFPSFIKYYQPNLRGASVGDHGAELCAGSLCPPFQYKPTQDILNAAQSAARASNLQHELDYLIPAITNLPGGNLQTDWKIVTLQIGTNDQCSACDDTTGTLTPEAYGNYVRAAIQRIQQNVPRVILETIITHQYIPSLQIKVIASRLLAPRMKLRRRMPMCQDRSRQSLYGSKLGRFHGFTGYTAQLKQIYQEYQSLNSSTFAVLYTPYELQMETWPLEAYSNVDCFHPSIEGQQWMAKVLWNQLYLPQSSKPTNYTFDPNLQVNCPTSTDRIQLN
ncbi:unnamed protein product [Umbelopsis sp. WA50703]